MANAWKSTYDRHKTRDAVVKDAARRRKIAAANGSGRTFAIRAFHDDKGPYWVVYTREK